MDKRPISDETKAKVLKCAAVILRMHAGIAGKRVCQDWSGDEDQNPVKYFSPDERDDLEYNSQIENSNLEDYEKGLDFFHDEMSVSFTMANALEEIAEEFT